MPTDEPRRVDVLRYETHRGEQYRAVTAGEGEAVVAAHERERRKRRTLRWAVLVVVALLCVGYGWFVDQPFLGAVAAGVVVAAGASRRWADPGPAMVPELVAQNVFTDRAREEYDLAGEPGSAFDRD